MENFGETSNQIKGLAKEPDKKSLNDENFSKKEKEEELKKLYDLGKILFNYFDLNKELDTDDQEEKGEIKDSILKIEEEIETNFLSSLDKIRGLKIDFNEKVKLIKIFADYDRYLKSKNPHNYSSLHSTGGSVERARAVEVISSLVTDGFDSFKFDEWERLRDLNQMNNRSALKKDEEFHELDQLAQKHKRVERFLAQENWHKLDYEPFDPDLELIKINHFSPEERKNLSLDKIREIKEERLAEYKKQLIEQKKAIANIQIKLEEFIKSNPELGLDKLMEIVLLEAPKSRLAGYQIETFRKGLITYTKKHNAVEEYRSKYKNDKDLFEACFGHPSKGHLEIIKGPITLHFRCHNLEDYALIHRQKFGKHELLKDDEIKLANLSDGAFIGGSKIPELKGCITAENVRKNTSEEKARRTFVHEEGHVIERLFREEGLKEDFETLFKEEKLRDNIIFDSAEHKKFKNLEKYLRAIREDFEDRARAEIIVHMKEGKSLNRINKNLLLQKEMGGVYDYFDKWYEKEGKEEKDNMVNLELYDEHILDEVFLKIFIKEYKNNIINPAIDSILILRSMGFLNEEIINLLINEPLSKWSKVVGRLKEVMDNEKNQS